MSHSLKEPSESKGVSNSSLEHTDSKALLRLSERLRTMWLRHMKKTGIGWKDTDTDKRTFPEFTAHQRTHP